jgi:hypothetical protein
MIIVIVGAVFAAPEAVFVSGRFRRHVLVAFATVPVGAGHVPLRIERG